MGIIFPLIQFILVKVKVEVKKLILMHHTHVIYIVYLSINLKLVWFFINMDFDACIFNGSCFLQAFSHKIVHILKFHFNIIIFIKYNYRNFFINKRFLYGINPSCTYTVTSHHTFNSLGKNA